MEAIQLAIENASSFLIAEDIVEDHIFNGVFTHIIKEQCEQQKSSKAVCK